MFFILGNIFSFLLHITELAAGVGVDGRYSEFELTLFIDGYKKKFLRTTI